MENIISDHVLQIMEKPCFGFATSVDTGRDTFPCRFFGYTLDKEQSEMVVYLFKDHAHMVVDKAKKSGKLAVCATYAFTLEALQFKGSYLDSWDAGADDDLVITKLRKEYNDILMKLGLPDGHIDNWVANPALGVKMKINEVFNQTPAEGTGNKL